MSLCIVFCGRCGQDITRIDRMHLALDGHIVCEACARELFAEAPLE